MKDRLSLSRVYNQALLTRHLVLSVSKTIGL
jgi:hypothetical protein